MKIARLLLLLLVLHEKQKGAGGRDPHILLAHNKRRIDHHRLIGLDIVVPVLSDTNKQKTNNRVLFDTKSNIGMHGNMCFPRLTSFFKYVFPGISFVAKYSISLFACVSDAYPNVPSS